MKPKDFPEEIKPVIIPRQAGGLVYRCLGCGFEHDIKKLLYICPNCGQLLLLYDQDFDRLKKIAGEKWRQIFDYRKMLTIPALKGIYRYHEFIGPVIPLDAVVYLGEGHTPVIEANAFLQDRTGIRFSGYY